MVDFNLLPCDQAVINVYFDIVFVDEFSIYRFTSTDEFFMQKRQELAPDDGYIEIFRVGHKQRSCKAVLNKINYFNNKINWFNNLTRQYIR